MSNIAEWEKNEEIKHFREYLKIPSVHPNVDYGPCIEFLKIQATDLGLPMNVYYPADPEDPIVVITWVGTQPRLPAILLNSHMDVVPVFEVYWDHPPFDAEMDEEGRIFARGAQDVKCVGMQYLAAIRALKREGKTFKRTIHVVYVPDEEAGGGLGMQPFVLTDEFKNLNVGFSLVEGLPSPSEVIPVFYAEKCAWRIYFKINGPSGAGASLNTYMKTSGEKLHYLLNKMMAFRAEEVKRLEDDPKLKIGDVTTVNLTRVNGGIYTNTIPTVLVIGFDVRLAIDVSHEVFESQLHQWCEEAGGGITIEYESKSPRIGPTKTDDSNPYWVAFKNAVDEMDIQTELQVNPCESDSRHIRKVGIPALGFAPMNNTPVLFHDNNEFLKADTYLKGIEIYKGIISHLANVV